MLRRNSRRRPWLAGLLGLPLAGCGFFPVNEQIDAAVAGLVARPLDVNASQVADQTPPPAPRPPTDLGTGPAKLQLPPDLPGTEAPPLQLPPDRPGREQALNKLFPPLPSVGPDVTPAPGPEGQPLTLADLQRMAVSTNPLIRQAAADVEAARGAALQAGLYPNPTVGYEGDQVGSAGSAGQQGAFVDQVIKTGGKLKLAQAAASIDVLNTQLALRRAQLDLTAQVRGGYFAVLVARENVRVTRALVEFADEAFRIQVEQVKGGQAAAYEPLQLRTFAIQARAALVTARNRYVSAWKQLAAALGRPDLPQTELAGSADAPVPSFPFEAVRQRVLTGHTDLRTAENGATRARYNLRLAQVTPVPDVNLHVALQKDVPTNTAQTNVSVGLPLPVWDRNQGGIIQAQGQLARALGEADRVKNDLSQRLADAYERYETSRVQTAYFRRQVLPDLVRAYQGIYRRYQGDEPGKVGFIDLVNAQQTLGGALATYLTNLAAQWQSVVDVAALLQTDDLYQLGTDDATGCAPGAEPLEKLLTPGDVWHPALPRESEPASRPTAAATAPADVRPVSHRSASVGPEPLLPLGELKLPPEVEFKPARPERPPVISVMPALPLPDDE
jgi:cobalt-zinc-cadmium efflux system outer membrane protein